MNTQIKDISSRFQARYLKCLKKALADARQFLQKNPGQYAELELHKLKSILYATMGQLWTNAERLMTIHRMLRELFSIVSLLSNGKERERQAGLQIIDELEMRLQTIFRDDGVPE